MWFLWSGMAQPLPVNKTLFSQDRRALPSPSNRNQRDNSLEVTFGPSSAKRSKFCVVNCENWANCEYLSTRSDLHKQAIVQEFMLTRYFVDHKGRVNESIQNSLLQLMVNSFKSLAGSIWGRTDHCGWNTGISGTPAKSLFEKRLKEY